MRKKTIVLFILTLISAKLFAVDIAQLLSEAYSNSLQIQQIEKNYQESLLNRSISKLSGISLTVNVSDQSPVYTENANYLPPASATIAFSDADKKTDINLSAATSAVTLNSDTGFYTLNTSLGLAKTFNLKNFDTTDYSDLINSLKIELTHNKNLLNFKKSVLNDVISIMQTEVSVIKAEKSFKETEDKFNKALQTKELTENSTNYLKQQMNLESQRTSLSNQKSKLQTLYSNFEKNYGFMYFTVSSAEEANFNLNVSVEENTETVITGLSLKSAQQALDEKTRLNSSLKISANAGPVLNFSNSNGYEDMQMNLSAGVNLTTQNFSVSAKMQEKLDDDLNWTTPSLYIGGSWTAGNVKTKTEKAEITKLENAVFTAKTNLEDARYSLAQSVKSLEESIQNLQSEVLQLEIQKDYHKKILSYTEKLFTDGFVTSSELESAQADVKNDEIEELILKLKAQVLATDIEILSL